MRNVRQVTKSISPKENALWTLEGSYLFLREWAYEVYDTIEHPALGQCPRDAFARGMITAGERAHSLIPYDDEFRMLTLPTTPKTTAKVIPGRGVKINHFYYWSDLFRRPGVEGTQVSVRYEPFNKGVAFAYVCGGWTECHSEYYATFRNRSEREIMLATAELRRRSTRHSRQFYVTASRLAEFLESVESEEVLLKQRIADQELRGVLTLINNEVTTRELNENTKIISTSPSFPSGMPPQEMQPFNDAPITTELNVYEEF